MTFEQIDCFIAAVHADTFFDAAELLHTTQSTLSKQIQKLEKELIRYENLFKIIYQKMHFIKKIRERQQSYGTESKRFEKCPEASGKYAGAAG